MKPKYIHIEEYRLFRGFGNNRLFRNIINLKRKPIKTNSCNNLLRLVPNPVTLTSVNIKYIIGSVTKDQMNNFSKNLSSFFLRFIAINRNL